MLEIIKGRDTVAKEVKKSPKENSDEAAGLLKSYNEMQECGNRWFGKDWPTTIYHIFNVMQMQGIDITDLKMKTALTRLAIQMLHVFKPSEIYQKELEEENERTQPSAG